jgi:Ras-related GTP-binding protein A/B
MGLAESGKTTIIKVVAEGFVPQKKAEYNATIDYKRKSYNMFGKKISLFDLGGQKSFLDRFVGDLAEFIFTNVATMIYVFDIVNMSNISQAKYYYDLGLKTLKKYSPDANITLLLHKVDLIDQNQKDGFIDSIKDYLELDDTYPIYETTIHNKTIFDAMEVIINELSLDPQSIEGTVQNFEKQYKDYVEEILLVDGRDNTIVSTVEDNLELKERLKQAQQTLEASFNINEPLSYSFYQFKSKLAFISALKEYHSLLIIFSANKPETLDETYIKLLNSSLSLSKDLNNLL